MKQTFTTVVCLAAVGITSLARAQTLNTGQQVNCDVSLTGTSYTNAEAFKTDVSGGGPNGPGAAQITMHLLDKKLDWDNTNPPPTGEVDGFEVDAYNGGPVNTGNGTADTSGALITAHNNCNGFSNAIEAQASQYLPGNGGNSPLL